MVHDLTKFYSSGSTGEGSSTLQADSGVCGMEPNGAFPSDPSRKRQVRSGTSPKPTSSKSEDKMSTNWVPPIAYIVPTNHVMFLLTLGPLFPITTQERREFNGSGSEFCKDGAFVKSSVLLATISTGPAQLWVIGESLGCFQRWFALTIRQRRIH